jgi:hypothetical protein
VDLGSVIQAMRKMALASFQSCPSTGRFDHIKACKKLKPVKNDE